MCGLGNTYDYGRALAVWILEKNYKVKTQTPHCTMLNEKVFEKVTNNQ